MTPKKSKKESVQVKLEHTKRGREGKKKGGQNKPTKIKKAATTTL